MRPENIEMKQYLNKHGIKCRVKYIRAGSLRGCWRLYSKGERWTAEPRKKLTALGFVDFDGRPLSQLSGNGGLFAVFARHPEINF